MGAFDDREQKDAAVKMVGELDAEIVALKAERDEAVAVIAAIKAARSNHPKCDVHDANDVIKCGWKRAVIDTDAALAKATS